MSVLDPTAVRSERLPTVYFDTRFSDGNLTFWVPLLVQSAGSDAGLDVLDVGCGNGGFTRAIADATGPAAGANHGRGEAVIGAERGYRLPRTRSCFRTCAAAASTTGLHKAPSDVSHLLRTRRSATAAPGGVAVHSAQSVVFAILVLTLVA